MVGPSSDDHTGPSNQVRQELQLRQVWSPDPGPIGAAGSGWRPLPPSLPPAPPACFGRDFSLPPTDAPLLLRVNLPLDAGDARSWAALIHTFSRGACFLRFSVISPSRSPRAAPPLEWDRLPSLARSLVWHRSSLRLRSTDFRTCELLLLLLTSLMV